MVTQDSQSIAFPQDIPGSYQVVGYIYTNCQSVCPAITANMVRIEEALREESDVHFVAISFDPQRDRPAVLRKYMRRFEITGDRFTFLTGDSVEIRKLLNKVDVRVWKKEPKDSASGVGSYMYVHTNRIHLIDSSGRVRGAYRGSTVKPEQIKQDLAELRE